MGVSTSSRVLVPRACCQYTAPTGRTASRVSTPRAAPWCVALTEFSARRRAGYPASSVACGARRPRAGAAWRRSAWRRPPGPGHAVARSFASRPIPIPPSGTPDGGLVHGAVGAQTLGVSESATAAAGRDRLALGRSAVVTQFKSQKGFSDL